MRQKQFGIRSESDAIYRLITELANSYFDYSQLIYWKTERSKFYCFYAVITIAAKVIEILERVSG